MALTTFHLFAQLPQELRDIIWDAAIRPDVPSAHFFTAWNGEENKQHDDYSTMADRSVVGRGHKHGVPCGLAAPRSDRTDPDTASWFDDNPSAYMVDSALWTACWDSREAMIRRFGNRRVVYRKNYLTDMLTQEPPECDDSPATGTMVQDGKRQYFTVCPKTDLICLQPFNKHSILLWPTLESDVPIFNIRGSPRPHIALEFDPAWVEDEKLAFGDFHLSLPPFARYETELYSQNRTELGCVFQAGTAQLGSWAENLWLIDYRISRRPEAEPLDYNGGGRIVFQGRDCKYVEVKVNEDEEGKYWIMGHNRPRSSIRSFLTEFRLTLTGYDYTGMIRVRRTGGIRDLILSDVLRVPHLGVLACIADD
ncbi:hypothetical protein F4805DRAFT_459398 [Annulohypoxylon moriforme]|nr:hypothetical protein F4805DRAFT_459398 [Annulohypoxylon moriforme]